MCKTCLNPLKQFNWVKVDVGQTVDQCITVFNYHTLKSISPEIASTVMSSVVKTGKTQLNLPNELGKAGPFFPIIRYLSVYQDTVLTV